jgi:hypothetical protein
MTADLQSFLLRQPVRTPPRTEVGTAGPDSFAAYEAEFSSDPYAEMADALGEAPMAAHQYHDTAHNNILHTTQRTTTTTAVASEGVPPAGRRRPPPRKKRPSAAPPAEACHDQGAVASPHPVYPHRTAHVSPHQVPVVSRLRGQVSFAESPILAPKQAVGEGRLVLFEAGPLGLGLGINGERGRDPQPL